jgi:osmotically-inducible protein OsmY
MREYRVRETGHLPYPYGETTKHEDVLSAVLNAFHWHPGVPSERVRVEVRGGHVVLSGVVAREYERSLCENTAAATLGVEELTNLIVVEN